MELTSRETIEYLCKTYRFWPQRSAGQNFLISDEALQTIVATARLSPHDTVLEIGAGFGTLTVELAGAAAQVIAVELDKRLAKALRKLSAVNKSMSVIEGDIFQQWPVVSRQLTDLQYKLVSNLPYNITSWVLRNFLEQKPRPSEAVLLVQKEVAQRVTAPPGEMSLLSVAVQFYGVPKIVSLVSRDCFWPEPEVDSAILHIQEIGADHHGYQRLLKEVSPEKFFRVVKIGFSAKRKQLHNNISAGLRIESKAAKEMLTTAGVQPTSRPQDLTIEDWIRITHLSKII